MHLVAQGRSCAPPVNGRGAFLLSPPASDEGGEYRFRVLPATFMDFSPCWSPQKRVSIVFFEKDTIHLGYIQLKLFIDLHT
jgi:hypothetical protein